FGNSASGLTAAQVGQIQFLNPAGLAPGIYDAKILSSGEVVPLPEAQAIIALLVLMLPPWASRRFRPKLSPQQIGVQPH
ncbi:MAG: hypothetical protein AAF571_12995, partial [Verrucomicrobiota bacterium]